MCSNFCHVLKSLLNLIIEKHYNAGQGRTAALPRIIFRPPPSAPAHTTHLLLYDECDATGNNAQRIATYISLLN